MGVAVADRYVLVASLDDGAKGAEWRAVDTLLNRGVCLLFAPDRPASAAHADTDTDTNTDAARPEEDRGADPEPDDGEATAAIPIAVPVADGRRVLDGGVHDGRAYLVVECRLEPAGIDASTSTPIPILAGIGHGTATPALRTLDDTGASSPSPGPHGGWQTQTGSASPAAGSPVIQRDRTAETPVVAIDRRPFERSEQPAVRHRRSPVLGAAAAAILVISSLALLVVRQGTDSVGTSPAAGDTVPAASETPSSTEPVAGADETPSWVLARPTGPVTTVIDDAPNSTSTTAPSMTVDSTPAGAAPAPTTAPTNPMPRTTAPPSTTAPVTAPPTSAAPPTTAAPTTTSPSPPPTAASAANASGPVG